MKRFLISLLFVGSFLKAQLPQKVLICGVCKNEEKRLPYSLRIIEKIGALFSDYHAIIYENNSVDATPSLLNQWKDKTRKATIISEYILPSELEVIAVNRLQDGAFFVPELLAYARNKLLQAVLLSCFDAFDYVIMMDLDFKLEPDYEGFIEVFTSNESWDAVFAYGVDPTDTYWDWYALRDGVLPIGSELLGNDWWYMPKKLSLGKKDGWYPVYSAFGGCGIYKREALRGCSYSGRVTQALGSFYQKLIYKNMAHPIIQKYLKEYKPTTRKIYIDDLTKALTNQYDKQLGIFIPGSGDDIVWRMSSFVYKFPSVCEHVPLHAQMQLNGYKKMFINPRLVFRYGG